MAEAVDTSSCRNCGAALMGDYCHECGQKQFEEKERNIRHLIYQFFGASFFLENNFLKNIRDLLLRPGYLAKDYVIGRRKQHMVPFSLFLLINLLYFIFNPFSDLSLSLDEQRIQVYWPLVEELIDNKLEANKQGFDAYATLYNNQSLSLSKSLVILNVPILAFFMYWFYSRKKYYYADHFVFSLYYMGFVMLLAIVLYGLLLLFNFLFAWNLGEVFPLFFFGIIAIYTFVALRKFYEQNKFWSLIKTLVVIFGFLLTQFVYRIVMFFIVFWTT